MPSARLEAERWREVLTRDAVAVRLVSLCDLLEDEVAALEGEVRDGRFAAAKASEAPPLARSSAPAAAAPPAAVVGPVPSPPSAVAPPREPALPAPVAAPAPAPVPAPAPAPPPPPDARPVAALTPASLSGKLEEGLLADVLQMISANHKSGLLRIAGAADEIRIWFVEGEIHHAQVGEMVGENAFFAALAEPKGTFRLEETTGEPPARSITSKTQFLILEGLRKIDEEGQGEGEGGEPR